MGEKQDGEAGESFSDLLNQASALWSKLYTDPTTYDWEPAKALREYFVRGEWVDYKGRLEPPPVNFNTGVTKNDEQKTLREGVVQTTGKHAGLTGGLGAEDLGAEEILRVLNFVFDDKKNFIGEEEPTTTQLTPAAREKETPTENKRTLDQNIAFRTVISILEATKRKEKEERQEEKERKSRNPARVSSAPGIATSTPELLSHSKFRERMVVFLKAVVPEDSPNSQTVLNQLVQRDPGETSNIGYGAAAKYLCEEGGGYHFIDAFAYKVSEEKAKWQLTRERVREYLSTDDEKTYLCTAVLNTLQEIITIPWPGEYSTDTTEFNTEVMEQLVELFQPAEEELGGEKSVDLPYLMKLEKKNPSYWNGNRIVQGKISARLRHLWEKVGLQKNGQTDSKALDRTVDFFKFAQDEVEYKLNEGEKAAILQKADEIKNEAATSNGKEGEGASTLELGVESSPASPSRTSSAQKQLTPMNPKEDDEPPVNHKEPAVNHKEPADEKSKLAEKKKNRNSNAPSSSEISSAPALPSETAPVQQNTATPPSGDASQLEKVKNKSGTKKNRSSRAVVSRENPVVLSESTSSTPTSETPAKQIASDSKLSSPAAARDKELPRGYTVAEVGAVM